MPRIDTREPAYLTIDASPSVASPNRFESLEENDDSRLEGIAITRPDRKPCSILSRASLRRDQTGNLPNNVWAYLTRQTAVRDRAGLINLRSMSLEIGAWTTILTPEPLQAVKQ